MPVKPKKLAICPVNIITAIPEVKPIVTGRGMNLINEPNLKIPIRHKIIPASKPASSKSSYP